MRPEVLKQYEGKIVTFDMINGREITTRVQEVNSEDRVVVCSKPRLFVPVPNPNNPNEAQVVCLRYGHPMYQSEEVVEFESSHILMVFEPGENQKAAYSKNTSGIVPAGANALDQLEGIDLSKFGNNN